MKLADTTNPACNAGLRTIVSSASVLQKLDQISRLRFNLVGLYHSSVGSEWSSEGKLESDFLHHIEIALSGRRQVIFRGDVIEIEQGKAYWFPGNGLNAGLHQDNSLCQGPYRHSRSPTASVHSTK